MNEILKSKRWKEICKIKIEDEVVVQIVNCMFKLFKLTNMTEKQIDKKFQILNGYCCSDGNDIRQRVALYEMLGYIDYLENKKESNECQPEKH